MKTFTKNAAKPKKPATLWGVIGFGLSLGFFLIVIALAVITIVIPKVTGSTPLTVLTSSMEPRLPPGTLLIIRPIAIKDIRIGDVVTYQIQSGKPQVITHRVTAIHTASTAGGRTFTFKGDNNSDPDPMVVAQQIQGRLWYSLPWIGYASTALSGPYRSWAISAIAGLLLLYAATMLISAVVTAIKNQRQPRHGASRSVGKRTSPRIGRGHAASTPKHTKAEPSFSEHSSTCDRRQRIATARRLSGIELQTKVRSSSSLRE
jgi:signal peptidase